jgi:protein-L-isoaspartate(D-aspartate) O-methyltransferase
MNVERFEEQRRQLLAVIRATADRIAAEVGKTALDERVLGVMAKVPRHEFVPVDLKPSVKLRLRIRPRVSRS